MAENIKLRERSVARSIIAHYSGNPTISLSTDGGSAETFSIDEGGHLDNSDTYNTRTIGVSKNAIGYIFHLSADTTDIMAMHLVTEPTSKFMNKLRFLSVELQYRGRPQVLLVLDGAGMTSNPDYGPESSSNQYGLPALGAARDVGTATLYFPAESLGYIPHVEFTRGGEVLSVKYNTEEI